MSSVSEVSEAVHAAAMAAWDPEECHCHRCLPADFDKVLAAALRSFADTCDDVRASALRAVAADLLTPVGDEPA